MSLSLQKTLNDDELDQLEDFLYSDQVSEDSLDLVGVHGLFCALNISPVELDLTTRLELVFDSEPSWQSEEEKQKILGLLDSLYRSIGAELYSDDDLDFPFELSLDPEGDEEISALSWWSQSFMEGVFTQEAEWFGGKTEEDVAEMLLPIMVASDLFDEEEISNIRENEALCAEMCSQIPELLVDLYLFFHAPDK